MVLKKEIRSNREYLTRRAKEVKVNSIDVRLAHTRKSSELNLQKNCKIKVEKELTGKQSRVYNEILKKERDKNYEKAKKRRETISKKKRMIIQ